MNDLLPAFTNLLKDPEGEVRSAAAQRIQGIKITLQSFKVTQIFVATCRKQDARKQ